jgi:hypothetical protein
MTIPILVSLLAGLVIGLRFKVFMVIPAVLVAAILTIAIAIAQGSGFWPIVLATALSVISVQIGYLCTTFVYSIKDAKAHANASPGAPADAYRSRAGASFRPV